MSLTNQEASIILGMIARGDDHHDIAAWFGVNQGRIDDVKKGKYGVSAAPVTAVPPKGAPGVKGRRLRAFVEKAIAALDEGNVVAAKQHLTDGMTLYNKHES